jgi:transcriptional regulator with XRE-family HTH domain
MTELEESRRVAELLERLLLFRKLSIQQVETDLDLGRGTLGRIFSGKIELKYRHIIAILKAIDLSPEIFFQIAYNIRDLENPQQNLLQLRQVEPPPPPPPITASRQQFEEAVVDVLRKLQVLPSPPSGKTANRKKKSPPPEE